MTSIKARLDKLEKWQAPENTQINVTISNDPEPKGDILISIPKSPVPDYYGYDDQGNPRFDEVVTNENGVTRKYWRGANGN